MPAGPADIGISSIATPTSIQSVEFEISLTIVGPRAAVDGTFAQANAIDPLITGSLEILGDSSIDLGVAASGITGISAGVTVWTEKTETDTQDDYNTTSVSFENAPGAEVGAAV
jgi:hypothetical protein